MTPGVYDVNHSRKGRFRMRVDSFDGEFATGVILKGIAKSASIGSDDREEGDPITVRESLGTFTRVEVTAPANSPVSVPQSEIPKEKP